MKKLVIYSDNCLSESSEFFKYKEPKFLHNIIGIVFCLLISVFFIIFFCKCDDVVHARGVVRPIVNVSSVKNIYSGEIENLMFKSGEFVKSGTELLRLKNDSVLAEKNDLENQLKDVEEYLFGIECILKTLNENLKSLIHGEFCSDSINSKFKLYLSEVDYLTSKMNRAYELFIEEKNIPDYLKVLSNVKNAEFNYQQSELELKEYKDSFFNEIQNDLRNYSLKRESYVQQISQICLKLENFVIKAPVDGYVFEISSLNIGDYIFSDQEILNLIPSETENLKIELQVPADRVGKIKKGQKVRFRFPTFPYYEFKGLEGEVKLIQPDSEISQSGSLFYKIEADVLNNVLKNMKGEVYKIKSGLEVDAKIILKTETILYFLLRKLDFWN